MRLAIDLSGLAYRQAAVAQKMAGEGTVRPIIVAKEVIRVTASYIRQYEVSELIFAMDGGYEARSAIYPEYKAQRQDSELRTLVGGALEIIDRICYYLPIIAIKVTGVEADDILSVLAAAMPMSIMSMDRDLYQLTRYDGVSLMDYDGGQLEMKYNPAQHLAYKVLVGDPSDNVKGVLGLGKKTADLLLSEHHSLKNILLWARRGNKLGRMTYEEAIPIVKRNLKLMKLDGSLLTEFQHRLILAEYDALLNSRKVDVLGLKKTLALVDAGLPGSMRALGIANIFSIPLLNIYRGLEK